MRSTLQSDGEPSTLHLLTDDEPGLFARDWSAFHAIAFTHEEFRTIKDRAATDLGADYPIYLGLVAEDSGFDGQERHYETHRVVLRGFVLSNGEVTLHQVPTDVIVRMATL